MIDDIRLMNDMRVKNRLLENLAMKDELTGVYNRHYLDQTLHAEMERQDRYSMPLSLIMIDIDHFKLINDNFGHDVGDIVLTEIAHRISNGIRETDVLFRWGGEEFFILMPHTEISGAALLADKLRIMVSSVPINPVGIISASFGVAERSKGEPRNDVFRRIDQALYRAKNGGRNRVEIQTEYVSTSGTVRLEWNKEWESGNAKIDAAHKILIQMGNEFLNLSISQASNSLVLEKINRLIDHLRTHFSEEETILSDSGYPGMEEHSRIHQTLLSEALTFHDKFLAGECESSLIFNFIVNRIVVDHLLSTDMRFFPYLKKE
jgi:diguanylate cyclase (GGDEF)-like protein/hemerythrin-like metal-binding protein